MRTQAQTEYLAAVRALNALTPRIAGQLTKAEDRVLDALDAVIRETLAPKA